MDLLKNIIKPLFCFFYNFGQFFYFGEIQIDQNILFLKLVKYGFRDLERKIVSRKF